MNRFIFKLKNMFRSFLGLAFVFAIQTKEALADLPTMQDPSRGAGKGIMDTIKNHAYDGAILGGLLLGVVGFFVVASSLIATYGEIQSGKKKWSDLGMSALVGAILLVVIIWLITEAIKIL